MHRMGSRMAAFLHTTNDVHETCRAAAAVPELNMHQSGAWRGEVHVGADDQVSLLASNLDGCAGSDLDPPIGPVHVLAEAAGTSSLHLRAGA